MHKHTPVRLRSSLLLLVIQFKIASPGSCVCSVSRSCLDVLKPFSFYTNSPFIFKPVGLSVSLHFDVYCECCTVRCICALVCGMNWTPFTHTSSAHTLASQKQSSELLYYWVRLYVVCVWIDLQHQLDFELFAEEADLHLSLLFLIWSCSLLGLMWFRLDFAVVCSQRNWNLKIW